MADNNVTDLESDLDDVLNYKLKIDFSKLVSILRECRRSLNDNAREISSLNAVINSMREDKEEMRNLIQDCVADVQQNSMSMTRFNEKIIDLETGLKKDLSELDKRSKSKEEEFKQIMNETLNKTVKKTEDKMENVLIQMKKLEESSEELVRKVDDKIVANNELENKIEALQGSFYEEIGTLE